MKKKVPTEIVSYPIQLGNITVLDMAQGVWGSLEIQHQQNSTN